MKTLSDSSGIYQLSPFGSNILVAFSGREFSQDRREEFLSRLQLSAPAFFLKQVHGNRILEITPETQDTSCEEGDGLMTQTNTPLGIRTADCMPVFFADQDQKVVALIHAGWRGLHQGILEKAVHLFKENYGVTKEKIRIFIGPFIRTCCYEVGDEFCSYFPETCAPQKGRKPHMDLYKEALRRLKKEGISAFHILDSEICTACQNHLFFSARKEKTENRIFSVIQIKG